MSARADLISIAQAIDDFHTQKGRYPATLIELVVPGESGATFLTCTSVPKDPWKREYVYAPPDPEHHRVGILLSWGRDGKPGGEGDDGDIVQWIQLSETGSPK